MKKIRAYLSFFLVILLLSSLGVAAEKAVRSVKAEFAMSHSVSAGETAATVDQGLNPVHTTDQAELSWRGNAEVVRQ